MKKPSKLTFLFALLFSMALLLSPSAGQARTPPAKSKSSKASSLLTENLLLKVDPLPPIPTTTSLRKTGDRYPWKQQIVTTVFWIGEDASGHNPVPNHSSSWDAHWDKSYGGFDDPNPAHRQNFSPAGFTPHQNPFYCALPYNDKANTGHRAEAPNVVPWFKDGYQGPGISVCKDRWVEIRKGNRVVYAQWEDAGPFRTDHWQYVFGSERPKPNLNKGAGLDVSPAVRDYLGLETTDVTDWKFVDFNQIPPGPWATRGENNTFVINARKSQRQVAQIKRKPDAIVR